MGSINWMNGPMGIANAERHLDYIRIITEFISQVRDVRVLIYPVSFISCRRTNTRMSSR